METKKLTCCDLMIGDWVMYDPNVFIEDEYEPYKEPYPCQIESGVQIDDAVNECYSPIPLTVEILEKNGFKKHRDIFYRLAIHIDEFNGFMFTLGKDLDGVFCLQSNRFVRFTYVHELQHALRLCGVDNEIVL